MDPFVAEIRIFAGNFPPRGWALCEGQLMSISQNTALFSLLGTTYGGDGSTTFGLPDLRDRAPMHPGSGAGLTARSLGETSGAATVTLGVTELPTHGHRLMGSDQPASDYRPTSATFALSETSAYHRARDGEDTPSVPLGAAIPGAAQPHNNLQPSLALTFIIALQGVFPPRS